MSAELIVGHLKNVLDQEMVSFDEPALWLLGRAADGSMRDALSLTDQAIAFGSGKLSETDVRAMLGTVDLSFVYRLLEAVAAQDGAQALAAVEEMSEHAPDYAGSLQEMGSVLHRVAVAQAVPTAVDNSWGDGDKVIDLAGRMTAEDVQLYYQLALTGRRDIGLAPDLRSGFEMNLLRMIAFRPVGIIEEDPGTVELREIGAEVAAPAKKPEISVASAPLTTPLEPASDPEPEPRLKTEPEPEPEPKPEPEPAVNERVALEPARWAELLDKLPLKGIVYNVASHCELRQVDGEKAYMVLDEVNASLYSDSHAQRIATALAAYLGRNIEVFMEVGVPRYETPASLARRLLEERQAQAVASIEADPKVQLLLERFEATLDRESITPIKH
jgi:DNA polymerase-3 subunit gamma/tau